VQSGDGDQVAMNIQLQPLLGPPDVAVSTPY
jgi:hypothetical protein